VVTTNDPEFYEIPWSGSTPDEFLAKGEEALKSLATRLNRQMPQQEAPGSPSARLPGPVGVVSSGSVEALTKELEALQRKRYPSQADINRRKEIVERLVEAAPKR
jgi:uncharacterized protein YgbK (DUF1537 family)